MFFNDNVNKQTDASYVALIQHRIVAIMYLCCTSYLWLHRICI